MYISPYDTLFDRVHTAPWFTIIDPGKVSRVRQTADNPENIHTHIYIYIYIYIYIFNSGLIFNEDNSDTDLN